MNPPKKLTSRQQTDQQQQSETRQQATNDSALEFNTVEEMLRHDALHTPVPPDISRRLAKSLEKEPRPAAAWWKRFFGGGA